jgi:hypothetical protein
VAHPPLPLQEFLPLHPASPVLHPPWPLHEFCPLQECFPLSESASVRTEVPALVWVLAAYVCTAREPLNRPAIAAPAINAFDGFMLYRLFYSEVLFSTGLCFQGAKPRGKCHSNSGRTFKVNLCLTAAGVGASDSRYMRKLAAKGFFLI